MNGKVSHYAKGKLDEYMRVYKTFDCLTPVIEKPFEDGSEEDAIRQKIHDNYIGLLDSLDEMMGHMETIAEFAKHTNA